VNDALFQLVDVVGGAEAGLAPGLFAEEFGQALFELTHSCGEADRALLGGEQVGVQRGVTGGAGGGAGGGLGGQSVDLPEEVAVAGAIAVTPMSWPRVAASVRAVMTRCRRRAVSARRPSAMAAVRGFAVVVFTRRLPVADRAVSAGCGACRA
jgi:hypothetical protein